MTRTPFKLSIRTAAILATLLAAGCAATKDEKLAKRGVEDYLTGDYAAAVKSLTPPAAETDENYVLNNLRLGSSALAAYDLGTAESAFLKAWEVINAGGVNNAGRTAAAVIVDEKIKVWKGEPYERAMASLDLGLVYLLKNDFNNARAGFENALFKLRDYADATADKNGDYTAQESTFAIAHILLGRCWQRLAREDLARAAFADAVRLRPELAGLADYDRQLGTNVLLVVDYGYGPRKRSEYDGTAVAFYPTPRTAGRIPRPHVIVDGRDADPGDAARPPIDTVAMAADRRWQSLDTIRVSKDVIGTGLIAGGAGYGLYRLGEGRVRGQDLAIAGGLIALGSLLRASSNVDTRQWEMVPRTTFLLPLTLTPGRHDVTVNFPDVGIGQTLTGLTVPDAGDMTYYVRMNRFLTRPADWPPGPPGGSNPLADVH